ncbi:MAG: HBL/NHE enterotoxin family protein [Patulibacter minatonensis]
MTATTASTTTDPTPPPAPDNLFGNTTVSYTNAQMITFACQAVANTVFTQPTPKPSWYDDLNAELVAAQNLAAQWLGTLGPKVTSTIPLQVINFNSDFQASIAAILQIVQANPTAQGKDNPFVQEVRSIIADALIPSIQPVITQMTSVASDLSTWGASMQTAHNNLSGGAANIQAAEASLQGDIQAMNNAISNLNDLIAQENKAIAASAAAIGVGIFALIVGIALAPETGGASLLIGGAIGAAGIVGGSVTWGIMQHRIDENFATIAKDQAEKADDQRQIVALQGLATASNGAVSAIEEATAALSKLQTQWATFQGELQDVVDQLDLAENALSTVVQGVFTQAAANEWAAASTSAQALVNAKPTIDSQTLPMNSQQAA